MNDEERKHESGRDIAHYKKVSNCHASGHGHGSWGRFPSNSPLGHRQIWKIVSDDNNIWADRFIQIKPCKVNGVDVLKDHMFAPTDCTIAQCRSKNCKTCKTLITDNSFSSNFTKRSFTTHCFDNLSCKSTNLVYGIECGLCGLIYIGETKDQLRSRMNGHRLQINHGGNQLLYRHFNLPDHSILSMKVRILEKIYHPTNNPNLSTPFRRKREEHWIQQLGTAAPYGCNDHIDSIGNLTSPGCQSVNVLNLFDRTSRRHWSHGSKKYNKPEIHDVSFDGLLPFVNLQLGFHHIRTKLYSLPLKRLHALYESTLTFHFADVGYPGHRHLGIVLDISSNRLFKAVRVGEPTETRNRPFLNVKFANKGIDALNVSNILNQKSVQNKIPPYFQYTNFGQMYPPELEIKDTTESNTSASYLDFLLSIRRDGQLRTSLYDKRDDFNFHRTNFPFLRSNIPSSPAYGAFILQLIRYARACSSYECFILRAMRLSSKLLGQGYVKERLKSSLRKFYVRYVDLTKQYEVPLSRMLHDILDDYHIQWHPTLIGHYTIFLPLLI